MLPQDLIHKTDSKVHDWSITVQEHMWDFVSSLPYIFKEISISQPSQTIPTHTGGHRNICVTMY